MNALMERWVQTCRRELLDRTRIWNQAQLLHALHEFEQSCNATGRIRESATPAHCAHCPHPSPSLTPPPGFTSEDATVSASSTSTGMPLNLHG
jgi:hypothetical protein